MWSPSFLRPTLWNDALDKNYLNLDGYAVKGWRRKGPNDAVLTSSSGGFDPRYTQYIFNKSCTHDTSSLRVCYSTINHSAN